MREILRLIVVLSLICGISAGALTVARLNLASRIEKQSDFYVRGPALERLFGKPAEELLGNKISLPIGDHLYPIFYLTEGSEITELAVEAPGLAGEPDGRDGNHSAQRNPGGGFKSGKSFFQKAVARPARR